MAWKKFTLRLKWNLYNRLRIYAESKGINMADAIRMILTDFLKDKNVI